MDKGRKAIATGFPRNRVLCLLSEWSGENIMTYTTEKKATSAYTTSQFFLGNAEEYMHETYTHLMEKYPYNWARGEDKLDMWLSQNKHSADLYEAVKVNLTLTADIKYA